MVESDNFSERIHVPVFELGWNINMAQVLHLNLHFAISVKINLKYKKNQELRTIKIGEDSTAGINLTRTGRQEVQVPINFVK